MRVNMLRDADALAFDVDHTVEATKQIDAATANLERPDSAWLDWPFPDLNKLCGRLAPRNVWFVCAFSGNGKTLFVTSAIRLWIKQGVKVYVMPLETTAEDFRTYLACQEVGIDPGIVLSGGLMDLHRELRMEWEQRVWDELQRQQMDRAVRECLKIKGVEGINLARLELAAEEAADWGARVVVVDHIDHIEGGDGSDIYTESVKVTKEALKLAKKYNLALLFTSQMNNASVATGKDRLAQFGPPMPHHVYLGGHKRQVATGMIGLHRKLRDRHDDETTDEYLAALAKSRSGELPPMEALQPNVMAVTYMKSRNFGAREGNRCFLGVEHGTVMHLAEKDQHRTSYEGRKQI